MTRNHRSMGESSPLVHPDPWILVFGGVTREGNRRARRSCSEALNSGFDVIWFDGFEEKLLHSDQRVPLKGGNAQQRLDIVGYSDRYTTSLSGRLIAAHWMRRRPVTRWIWRKVMRRIGRALRPRSGWTTIRAEVRALAKSTDPTRIVYCDDYAITSAWHAARIWRSVPISMTFTLEDH